ncbi:uncharacterized protein [Haliotis asinina]|uniref:uncharacterized protein n=1 Tax=Haliotis asinina TaxID=109174 RepID=UPI0035322EFC
MKFILLGLMTSLLTALQGADGLDCFRCVRAWTVRECMQSNPMTCGWGEICYTTIETGGFEGKKYTKGCMDASHCYSLQNINGNCDLDPSSCVYCCEGDVCNAGVTSLPVGIILYVLTSSLSVYLCR